MNPPSVKASVVPLYKRRPLSHSLIWFICVSSCAGPIALAEPQVTGKTPDHDAHSSCPKCALPATSALPQEAQDRKLIARDIFRATELRLVQGTTPGFSVEAVAGSAGTAIPVKISLPPPIDESTGAVAARRFLMFRGLPDGLTLSSGFQTRNVWIVAVTDAANLKMNVPPSYRGSFPVEVLLYRGEAQSPERRAISVEIAPSEQSLAEARMNVASKQDLPDNKRARPLSRGPLDALQEETELLSQGESHLRNGNIVFARAVFEELASRGSARGAFAVAQTYDAVVLQQIGAVGIQGDTEKAKTWYRKAAELGNTPPVDILSSLKKDRQ